MVIMASSWNSPKWDIFESITKIIYFLTNVSDSKSFIGYNIDELVPFLVIHFSFSLDCLFWKINIIFD